MGFISTSTLAVLADESPLSMLFNPGISVSILYPGNPETVVPAVCDNKFLIVTASWFANSFLGTFQDFKYVLISVSKSKTPFSTSFITASAVRGLLIDAAWNNVWTSTGLLDSLSHIP